MTLPEAVKQEAFWMGACFMFAFLVVVAIVIGIVAVKVEDIKAEAVAEYQRKQRETNP